MSQYGQLRDMSSKNYWTSKNPLRREAKERNKEGKRKKERQREKEGKKEIDFL